MEPDSELDELMLRYQGGDRDAATALIQRASPLLHRLFRAQTLSRESADDLLQETWLRLHKVRHTYRPGERFLPWFYAIARHTRIDYYRRTRRIREREEAVDRISEMSADAREPKATLDLPGLLSVLPEGQREVVAMLKLSEMSVEDVARATSSSIGSVKQKAHRAYAKLRTTLASMGYRQTGLGGRK